MMFFISGQYASQIKSADFTSLGQNEFVKSLCRPKKRMIDLKVKVSDQGITFEADGKKNYTADEVNALLKMASEFATASCGRFLWSPNV